MNIKSIHLLFLFFFVVGCSELREDESKIKDKYLQEIPLGSDYNSVNRFLKGRMSEKNISYHERYQCKIDKKWVNAKQIIVYLGWYLDLFVPVNTYLTWCFDNDNKLIELMVNKEIDGI